MQLCLRGEPTAEVPLDALIRAAAQAGYTCLDVAADTLADYLDSYPLAWLDARLREDRVYIAAVDGPGALASTPQVETLIGRAQLVETCTHLDALGGGVVTIRLGAQLDTIGLAGDHTAWIVGALRTLSDLAAPFEVRLALEVGACPERPVRSFAHSREIVRQVARPNVGFSLDASTLCLDDRELGQTDAWNIDRLWLVRLANDGHMCSEAAKPKPHAPVAERPSALRELCLRLSARGFVGPYSVPLSSGDRPLAEAARAARLAVLRLTQQPPGG